MKIVVTCGGTGGHVFPGLATARALRERGHEVEVWLSGRAVEESALPAWDGAVWRTGARPLALKNMPALFASLWRCWRRLGQGRYDRMLAMGSYASLPPALAARMRRVPLILHEANAVPGKAVDYLAPLAQAVAVSFPETPLGKSTGKRVLTGLPVRREVVASGAHRQPADDNSFSVFITGGSQGARAVNQLSCAALCSLAGSLPALRVLHQSGAADAAELRQRYEAAGVTAEVTPFVENMGRAYSSADLVICRAGAVTCAEVTLCRVPAILIPLPGAIRDHQRLNAAFMAQSGGAILFEQVGGEAGKLAELLHELAKDPHRREAMTGKLRTLGTINADKLLAELVENPCDIKSGFQAAAN